MAVQIVSGRMMGKTLEFKRRIGEQVYEACFDNGPRRFVVAGPKGVFKVTITKMRKPKAKVEVHGS